MKLHIGCGEDYKGGFVNLDNNLRVKADVYADLDKRLPFESNTFDYVLADSVIEHVKETFKIMEEIWRVCKPGATIIIHVPHYSGMFGRKYIGHYHEFGIGSFDCFSNNDASSQDYTTARFKVIKEKLHMFKRNERGTRYPRFSIFVAEVNSLLSFFCNFSRLWKLACEKFWIFGFDEISYNLEVVK